MRALFSYSLAKSVNPASSLLINLLVPLFIGIEGYGHFSLFYSVILGVVVFSKLGSSGLLLKELSASEKIDEFVEFKISSHLIFLLPLSILISIVFGFIFLPHTWILPFLLICGSSFTLLSILSVVERVFGNLSISPLIEFGAVQIVFILIAGLSFFFRNSLDINYGFYFLVFAFCASTLFLSIFFFIRSQFTFRFFSSRNLIFVRKFEVKERSLFYANDVIGYLLQYGVVVAASTILSATDLGVFSLFLRISFFSSFLIGVINGYYAPSFAKGFARGDRYLLMSSFRNAMRFSVLGAIALCFIFLLIFMVLRVFEFKEFQWLLDTIFLNYLAFSTLLIAQLINLVTGPSGPWLNMTGQVRSMLNYSLLSIGIGVAAVLVAIQLHFGNLLSLSIGLAVSISLKNILAFKHCMSQIASFDFRSYGR